MRPGRRPPPPRAARLAAVAAVAVLALAGGAWAALAPIESASREEPVEIPNGTWKRRMAGEPLAILPDTIRLTLGVKDVLALRNADDVPQLFGPALIMPGQSFRLPFGHASTYSFACSAHASGEMAVVVAPHPAPGWPRLRWRAAELVQRVARVSA